MTALSMSGQDRFYQPPRSLRRKAAEDDHPSVLTSAVAAGRCTAWDLLKLEEQEEWARTTLESVLASIATAEAEARGCTDCEDTGFYGVAEPDNEDLLSGLIKREGEGQYQALQTSGVWQDWDPMGVPLEMLDLELAGELAAAITAGASGLLRRYCWPKAFVPPCTEVEAVTAASMTVAGVYGVVDSDDPGAVMQIIRLLDDQSVEEFDGETWQPLNSLEQSEEIHLVPLGGTVLDDVLAQVAGGFPEHQKCSYCKSSATQRIIHSEGMAYIPVCDSHLDKGKTAAAACVPGGKPDPSNIDGIRPVSGGALVADAPLTVSPNPKAEKLRRYWSSGKGAAKIKWGAPGDWTRCYRHLRKYMGLRAKGYCQNLHKRNNHFWTGDRRNRGLLRGSGPSLSPEQTLMASLQTGQWTGEHEGTPDMPVETEALTDGIYTEMIDNVGLLASMTAGAFPVSPPDEWYTDPKLDGPTPLTVEDDGRVFGHIATFDVPHIGLPGRVHAPKSRSGYSYFHTGQLVTASGAKVNVGQLTLAGGHASLYADAAKAVEHYDSTGSGVADVHAGEDRHGIWVAGSLRPDVTAEQLRTLRASAPSGDWRPINGDLELVAVCQVNVPGFPVARAMAASGAITALVAAGARPLALLRASLNADAALQERVAALESALLNPAPVEIVADAAPGEAVAPSEVVAPEPVGEVSVAVVPAPESTPEPVVVPDNAAEVETTEQAPEAEAASTEEDQRIADARTRIAQVKADIETEALRRRVHGTTASVTPPDKKKGAAEGQKTFERVGGGFPIPDVDHLKKAIQAYGRAKPADRAKTKAHIISAAKRLKATDLIPDNWK